MKKLLLMRHAKSSWKDSDVEDHERPLKKRGKHDAERMGKYLQSKKLVPDVIISSTALRAQETADYLLKKLKYKNKVYYSKNLYMAEPINILDAIEEFADDKKTVMIIGHNPGLEAFLQIVTRQVESLPTGSVAYIKIKSKHWKDITDEDENSLKNLWRPKDLK